MNPRERTRTVVVLVSFAIVFSALTVGSYTQKSATWDESINLLSGYTILRYHDYRFSPGHVPFVRVWAAVPLVGLGDVSFDPTVVERTDSMDWPLYRQYSLAHEFLYLRNDADRLLYRARFMIVLLGVGLGILLYCWAREWLGFWPAVFALALYTLEPNILAHSSLVTTDMGLACFIFGAAYFSWRLAREWSIFNLLGLSLCVVLAQTSKLTAIPMLGIVCALLLVRALDCRPWPCRLSPRLQLSSRGARSVAALCAIVFMLVISYAGIWAAYGFRYCPDPAGKEQFHFDTEPYVIDRAPDLIHWLAWVDRAHLLPNAYVQGLLFIDANAQQRGAFLAGQFSAVGWWYYYPVAFLLKTPLSLLVGLAVGIAFAVLKWRTQWRDNMYTLLVPLIFFVGAMTTQINIGLRYVLLVYPFAILVAARAAYEFIERDRRWVPIVLVAVAALELATAYPHCLAFFNGLAGGPRNGYKYLVDSNLDWGQDLKGLKRWMDKNRVQQINLSYFGTADPAYYGIDCTHLPAAPFFVAKSQMPRLPGYVAVSVTNLRGVYLNDYGKAFYRPLLEREPDAIIGYSIYIYRVERPWWGAPPPLGGN